MVVSSLKNQSIEKVVSTGSKLFGRTGRVFGRAAGTIGLALTAYSVTSKYIKYVKNDADAKRIQEYANEMYKWSSAISCIGREPYKVGDICTLDKGGAINDLGDKIAVPILSTRYTQDISNTVIPPAPNKAKELVLRAIDYITDTHNNLGIKNFIKQKQEIIKQFKSVDEKLEPEYNSKMDYTPFQISLSSIVRKMVSIEWEYNLAISKLVNKLNKKKPGYAAEALFDGTIGEILKLLKIKQKE